MRIYVIHSCNFDFQNDLYKPIRESKLNNLYEFILPHETDETAKSKDSIKNDCDLVIAEVSVASTGMGIELGWADAFGVPVWCFYKKDSNPSRSLKFIAEKMEEYEKSADLITKLDLFLS